MSPINESDEKVPEVDPLFPGTQPQAAKVSLPAWEEALLQGALGPTVSKSKFTSHKVSPKGP